jgi:hypothetical protein
MAKAKITTKNGLVMQVDGTPAEISAVLQDLQRREEKAAPKRKSGTPVPVSLPDLIGSLVDGGFFKTPRDLAAVRGALREMGHIYPVTSLSGAMLGQVRRRTLRRIRKEKRWVYTSTR